MDTELERMIRERAYALWEADGRPEGRELEYWLRAEEEFATLSVAGEEDPLAALDEDEWREEPPPVPGPGPGAAG